MMRLLLHYAWHGRLCRCSEYVIHYPISGAFLKQLVVSLEISMKIINYFPLLNKDMIISGIILHDIGKVKSINTNLLPNYTDEGKNVGSAVLGRDIIVNAAKSIEKFPSDILNQLEHIIVSNNNSVYAGKVVEPNCAEAKFINYISEFNLKLNILVDSIRT